MNIHPLLEKQLAQCLPEHLQKNPEMEALLASVNESYHALQPMGSPNHPVQGLDGERQKVQYGKTAAFQDFTRWWGKRIKSRIFSETNTVDNVREDVFLKHPSLESSPRGEKVNVFLSTLACNFPNPVFWIDEKGTVLFANESFCQHIHYSQSWETLVGKSADFMMGLCSKLYKDEERFIRRIHQLLANKECVKAELLELADGRIMLRDFIPIFKDGAYGGAMVQYVDISKMSMNEKSLKYAERFNSRILNASHNGIVMIDERGDILTWNSRAGKLIGYSAEEAIGKKFSELVFDDTNRGFYEAEMIQYKQTGQCVFVDKIFETIIRDRANHLIEVGLYLVPIQQDAATYFCAFFWDDSARKNAEAALKASQEIWQFALEGSGDGIWDWDFEEKQVYFSPQCKSILGYEAHEFMNTQSEWKTLLHPDDMDMVRSNGRAYVENRIDSHRLEFRLKHKDGKYRWVLDRGKVMSYTPLGTPKRIIGYYQDITENKKIEDALRSSEFEFRSLAENIPGVLFKYEQHSELSEGFLFVTSNPELKIGMTKEQLENFYTYIHKDDLQKEKALSKLARDKNIPYHFEGRFVFPDKRMIWLSISSTITSKNELGDVVTTGIILNITKQKEAEQLLQMSEEKYRNIIANMHLGLLEVDLEGNITTANQSFCEMSGYSLDELMYKNASGIFLENEYQILMEDKADLRQRFYSDAYELPINTKNGEKKWWLISGAPSFNDLGKQVGSIGIHLDITKQKQLEMELKDAKRLAEMAANAKQQFLANVSHEIRTPMNVILGLTEQLQKSDLGSQQLYFLQSVHNAADHLMVIINDLLDLTKVEGGMVKLEKIGFSPKQMVERAFSLMRFKAEGKGLGFTHSFTGKELLPVLMGDPHRINQVLINLISNAIKFTQKGSVDIRISVVLSDDQKQTLQLSVADTGIGMEQKFVKNMFDQFSQEDSSVFRKFGGTGLGMSITKQLVELMGGFISVDTEKGKGTTVSVVLELEKGKLSSMDPAEPISENMIRLAGKKVLVADDNGMNQLLAKTILSNAGIEVVEANNGVEVLQHLKNDSFDLVLMDVQMPEMDGIQATKIIRHGINKEIPIIALTAMAFKDDEQLCAEAGMNDYLSKPFVENQLLSIVAKWTVEKKDANHEGKDIPSLDGAGEGKLYDLRNLREIARGDKVFMDKMVLLFIEESSNAVKQVVLAYMQKDWVRIQKIAHRLKPSVENMGISSLRDGIVELETKASEYQGCDRLSDLIGHFQKVIAEVVVQLQQSLEKTE